MNRRQRWIRKISQAAAIVLLLLPLAWLSQPATTGSGGNPGSKGGKLAQMRDTFHLGQAQLGDIDPASETIKLATLGMRGVAANVLWVKADRYKRDEDWTGLAATLEQIKLLQPNYVSVWIFQGWNLSYNISVEFDDYHDRYYWVIKGIDHLKEGTSYNKDDPQLLANIGWTIGHKIGRADEHLQYRRLFREDDEFNGSLPRTQRDNWLVGRSWLTRAQDAVTRGRQLRGTSPLLFHSHPPMCLINYAEAMEEEGTFGEVAKSAWQNASESWLEFANRDLPTQYGFSIRLKDQELHLERSKKAQAELAKLAPEGLRDQIFAERMASLSPEEREAYELTPSHRSAEQRDMMYRIDNALAIAHFDLADRITGENRAAALAAAEEATQMDLIVRTIDSDREVINYEYWLRRCQIEPEEQTLQARKLLHDGNQAMLAGKLSSGYELYSEGMKAWRAVLDSHPQLLQDSTLTEELVEWIGRYRKVIQQVEGKFPDPFILQDVLDADARFHAPPIPVGAALPAGVEPPGDAPAEPEGENPAPPVKTVPAPGEPPQT